jgi:hypothetical protein
MKKMSLVPLLAVGALVSQAWAINCLYGSGDCWPADSKNCEGGWQYEGGTTGEGTLCSGGSYIGPGPKTTGDPPTSLKPSLGCCKWDTETLCWDVFTQAEASDCGTGDNQFWSSACPDKQGTCPGGTPVQPPGGGSGVKWTPCTGNYAGYCVWGQCYAINTCTGGNENGTPEEKDCYENDPSVTSCQKLYEDCLLYSDNTAVYSNSTCTTVKESGGSPILAGTTTASLTVLAQSGNLHISALKEARVALFDMSGKEVFSKMVPAGYSLVSLKGQKIGVYYAVVSSGSSKQTVKIVLK